MSPETVGEGLTAIPKVKLKGAAKKIFEYTATELLHKGMLELVGLDLLVAYCREMAIYHELMAEVEKEGYTIEVEPTPKRGQSSRRLELPSCEGGRRSQTKNGTTTIINPKRKVAESALANAKSIASEYGFTPASRMRIVGLIAPNQQQDDFAEFEELK